jgi:hypothetical protein
VPSDHDKAASCDDAKAARRDYRLFLQDESMCLRFVTAKLGNNLVDPMEFSALSL